MAAALSATTLDLTGGDDAKNAGTSAVEAMSHKPPLWWHLEFGEGVTDSRQGMALCAR